MPRWRFTDPSESFERETLLAKVDAWWRAFAAKADAIDGHFTRSVEIDIPSLMRESLQAVDPRLMWEFGPALKKDGHRLVITPESERTLRPLVDALLKRAPELPRWEFYPYRMPDPIDHALATVQGRTQVDFAGTRVRLLKGEDSRIGLEFHSPACRHPEDARTDGAGFVAAESILGEETLDTWIGGVRTVPLRKPGFLGRLAGRKEDADLLPLESLKAEVEGRIEEALARLPDSPRYLLDREKGTYTMYKLEPKEREDERFDLYVAMSDFPEFFQAAHGPGIFSSRRLSRFDETFCYLKIDSRDVPKDEKIDFREGFDAALSAALRPAEAGGPIGGGTGLYYSYIDLALLDVDAALPILTRVLRERGAPARSWLLFFDDALADEWVGIQGETPPPPRS